MPAWGSFSFLFGPLIAVAGIGLLVVLARWATQGGTSLMPRPGRPDQYGMLVPVAQPTSIPEAEIMRRRLEAAGIRANVAGTIEGTRIMVWPADADRAAAVLRGVEPPDVGT